MTATTYKLEFPGAMNRRGFWLYVWRIESPAEGELLYVGRTGDSSSSNASSPIRRMGQHLGFNEKENMLRRHLSNHGIEPELCTSFEMIAYGPVFPEQKEWCNHKKQRNKIAALEKTLAGTLRSSGYNVMNTVTGKQDPELDLWQQVLREFEQHFPRLRQTRA